ncbi:pol, partial [Mucuna pruriens]
MTIHVRHQPRVAHCQYLSHEAIKADPEPWYLNIKRYLEKREYPKGAFENSKRTLRRLASGFLLSGTTYANHINVAPSTLHNLTSPWPFSMWSIDLIGPIELKASNGHKFILVAIDYFTKWVEAASYPNVTPNIMVRFIKRDIKYRYGLLAHIIINNDTNQNNKMMTELCVQFWIRHHNSIPYHPKMNWAVEVANKNLKEIVQKMVVTYKDWHEMLPYALHGYRTSVRTSTGATPYSLVCGTEAVLPIEVEIPSLRVLAEVELEEAEWFNNTPSIESDRRKMIGNLMSWPTLSEKDQERL